MANYITKEIRAEGATFEKFMLDLEKKVMEMSKTLGKLVEGDPSEYTIEVLYHLGKSYKEADSGVIARIKSSNPCIKETYEQAQQLARERIEKGNEEYVTVIGRVNDSKEFEKNVQDILGKGIKKLILDLGDVKRINSTGLAILITGFHLLANSGGSLALANLNDFVKGALTITKLDHVFKYYASVDEAIAA